MEASSLTAELGMVALIQAGILLRRNPRRSLAASPVGEMDSETTTETIFRQIVNASLDPVPEDIGNQFCAGSMGTINMCGYAERGFAKVYNALVSPYPVAPHRGARLFMRDGKPLVLQKGSGTRTGYLLGKAVVDGICIPEGALVGLTIESSAPAMPTRGIRRVSSEAIVHMSLMRLLMFALPPEERKPYAAEWSGATRTPAVERRVIESLTLDDMRRTVLAATPQ